ncbi:hypothetical protein [Streptomyces sp. cg2]|uniref:hypothetical protein n=1 Tax=Streptomyces sp. cg2 TaxID=3238799 RepID=UPI0034E25589
MRSAAGDGHPQPGERWLHHISNYMLGGLGTRVTDQPFETSLITDRSKISPREYRDTGTQYLGSNINGIPTGGTPKPTPPPTDTGRPTDPATLPRHTSNSRTVGNSMRRHTHDLAL